MRGLIGVCYWRRRHRHRRCLTVQIVQSNEKKWENLFKVCTRFLAFISFFTIYCPFFYQFTKPVLALLSLSLPRVSRSLCSYIYYTFSNRKFFQTIQVCLSSVVRPISIHFLNGWKKNRRSEFHWNTIVSERRQLFSLSLSHRIYFLRLMNTYEKVTISIANLMLHVSKNSYLKERKKERKNNNKQTSKLSINYQ